MELEARQLERHPVRPLLHQRHLGERQADVARVHGVVPERAQEVADERRRRRLAVRPGDGDVAEIRQVVKRDLDLPDHGHGGAARGGERRRVGRHAGAGDDERGTSDSTEVVTADVDRRAQCLERGGVGLRGVARAGVGRIDPMPVARQQRRHRASALPEPDDRDLAGGAAAEDPHVGSRTARHA